MKTLYLAIMLLIYHAALNAQHACCGIYCTVSDYHSNHISIKGNCQFGEKAIQISDFFLRPYVYLKTEQGEIKVREDSIYAIRDCGGNIYRIWDHKAYLLSDTGKFQIYNYTYLKTVKIGTPRAIPFEQEPKTDYYFSINDTSELLPLTLINIRLALLTDKSLDKKLTNIFSDNASLTTKNGKHFEINCLITDSVYNP